jgi:SSS family solute:Na+ symporter
MTPIEVNTASMALSMALAILGFGAGPLAIKLVLSTRNVAGVAAGHVWFGAAGLGALVVLGVAVLGIGALIAPDQQVPALLIRFSEAAPWLVAWLLFGLIAGMQVIAGLSLLVAAESLVRHVYKPLFHSRLSRRDTVTLTRITVVVLAVITGGMAFLTPLTLSALGGFALPASAQLIVPMLGLCWLGWLSRSAVLVGVGAGLLAAFLTESAGLQFVAWLGLDLPWGRWPWTIHSAGWGLFFNVVAALLVAAATFRQPRAAATKDIRGFLADNFAVQAGRGMRALGWAALLAWAFLAVGPGLVLGNGAFVDSSGAWLLGLPSLWIWGILSWMSGLGLVWFLAYRLGMAAPLRQAVPVYEPPPVLRPQQNLVEQERLRGLVVAALIAAGLITLLVWSFGNA